MSTCGNTILNGNNLLKGSKSTYVVQYVTRLSLTVPSARPSRGSSSAPAPPSRRRATALCTPQTPPAAYLPPGQRTCLGRKIRAGRERREGTSFAKRARNARRRVHFTSRSFRGLWNRSNYSVPLPLLFVRIRNHEGRARRGFLATDSNWRAYNTKSRAKVRPLLAANQLEIRKAVLACDM